MTNAHISYSFITADFRLSRIRWSICSLILNHAGRMSEDGWPRMVYEITNRKRGSGTRRLWIENFEAGTGIKLPNLCACVLVSVRMCLYCVWYLKTSRLYRSQRILWSLNIMRGITACAGAASRLLYSVKTPFLCLRVADGIMPLRNGILIRGAGRF
jgi:hypothetical protein